MKTKSKVRVQNCNRIAIIGSGPSGAMTAFFACKKFDNHVTIFDYKPFLHSILSTGNGRCNLSFQESDILNFVKNYPRGEKFLISVFNKFGLQDTLSFFHSIGVNTFCQEDRRIFPMSESSKDVRNKFLKALNIYKNLNFINEKVINIKFIKDKFAIICNNNNLYYFDKVVIAAGSILKSHYLLKNLPYHQIIQPQKALVPLETDKTFLYSIPGISIQNVEIQWKKKKYIQGDLLFAKNFLSGPIILKLSSLIAYENFPYTIKINFLGLTCNQFYYKLVEYISLNKQRYVLNLLQHFSLPKAFISLMLHQININPSTKSIDLNKQHIGKIVNTFCDYELIITKVTNKHFHMVTAGGVNLNQINPKNLESKILPNLYFVGEILNIDGLTGGFNLQNCWSTGFLVGEYLSKFD